MADIQYARIVGDWRRVVGDEIVSYENTEIGDVGIHGTVTLSPVWARGGPQGISADPGAYYSIHPVVCRVRYGRLYDPTNTVPYEDVAVEIDGQPLVWKAKFELAFRRRAGEAEVPLQVREVTFDNAAMVAGEIALTGILPASAIPAEYQAYFANAALSATLADTAKTTAVEAAGAATSAASTATGAAGTAADKALEAFDSAVLAGEEADRAIGLAGAQDEHIAGTLANPTSATHAAFKAVGNATYQPVGDYQPAGRYAPSGDYATASTVIPTYTTAGLTFIAENAPTFLTIPTYEGSGQAVHPHVVHVPTGFGGYPYWMAMTPYPGIGNDAHENPSILASHDGINWVVPDGVTNPLAPKPAGTGNFNSDPVLVFDGIEMHMFYRTVDKAFTGAEQRFSHMVSSDGVDWTAPEVVFTRPLAEDIVSPAVIYDAANAEWVMWVNHATPSPNQLIRYTAPAPAGPWSNPVLCTGYRANTPSTHDLWHMEVRAFGHEYVMMTHESPGGGGTIGGFLRRSTSPDGITWTPDKEPLLYGVREAWDNAGYKSSILPVWVNGRPGYRFWYGGYTTADGWRIGHTLAVPEVTPAEVVRDAAMGIAGWRLGDTFNRADSTTGAGTMTSGTAWTAASGTAGIIGGMLYAPTGTALVTADAGSNDVDVSCDFPNIPESGTGEVYLYARRSNSTNWIRMGVYGGGAGLPQFQLARNIAGSVSNVRNVTSPAPKNGDRLRMTVKGDLVRCYVNGRLILREIVTGVPAGTSVGVQVQGAHRADNFAAKAI